MLAIATGTSRRDTAWKNTQLSWPKLTERLATTQRTKETVTQYHSFDQDRKAQVKDTGGFVAGQLTSGRRKRENVLSRSMITLDMDFVTSDLWAMFTLVYDCAACVYSTHSHTPDAPRLRFIIPLSREVFPEEYEALARKVAAALDIEAADPTTYEASRLMYWPSTPVDGEYVFHCQDGPLLDPDAVLAEYVNWKDISEWPISSREKEIRERRTSKAAVPYLKPGVIGAFCQEYTISGAIDAYLSDVYTSAGGGRFTYAKGTTFGGMATYDEDSFAFSHHSTDPTQGVLCNAFDLVRIHLFGELDDKKEDTPINKRPSYLAMQDLATNDEKVKARLIASKVPDAEYSGENDEETEDDKAWLGKLVTDRKGVIQPTIDNLVLILANDKGLKGKFAYDLFENREVTLGDLPWAKRPYGTPLVDSDDANIWHYIEKRYGISNNQKLRAAVQIVAHKHEFHPIRDYILAAKWDGAERIDTFFIDFLGVRDSLYARTVSRKWLCGAVARVFIPGIKFDTMLVLVGEQGVGKSQIFDRLGMRWFSDSFSTVKGKEALEAIQGSWIIEVGELTGLRKADINEVKHFVSKRNDKFRVAYGRRSEEFPRQCVFAGTSNTSNFLRDPTGNRRFWPMVTSLSRATMSVYDDLTPELVRQIWAEAKHVWDNGEELQLSAKLEAEARIVQAAHTEEDERTGMILRYLDTPVPANWDKMNSYERRLYLTSEEAADGPLMRIDKVCASELWVEALNGRLEAMTRGITADIHDMMLKVPGWQRSESKQRFGVYGIQRGYERVGVAMAKAEEPAFLN